MTYCTQCTDEYEPVEYNEPSLDPDELNFCSDGCEETFAEEERARTAYHEARHGGAPIF